MTKPKYYFRNEDDERCYQKSVLLSDAKDEGLSEVELWEAKRQKIDGIFWCQAVDEACETMDTKCGNDCPDYSPKNGKSGMCRFKGMFYEPTGEKEIFKVKSNQ